MDWDPTSSKRKNEKFDPYIQNRNLDDYFAIAGELSQPRFFRNVQIFSANDLKTELKCKSMFFLQANKNPK